ncbi:MAG TPA: alpha-amylase family glycosyl hydrolase [Acidimicrobiales bacterium]|nr:alpha-amylase family glycosyl hydrolase [Acidimicrobiales bacterium]
MPGSAGPPPGEGAPWWQRGVGYQIYPRSFADTSGDGVGDLAGVRSHLDHLAWLGVDALWLSPVYRSPMRDFGYDVADHTDVDPVFGSLADLDGVIADAHARDLRVVLDYVPNHTSDQHRWFQESRADRGSARRDWYVWRDPAPDGSPPNNWRAAFTGGSAWTVDDATGQCYLHLFLPEQPDLNWDNPEVEAAMHDVLRFWLDRGVDGFRADVIHCIGKDPAFPDAPVEVAELPWSSLNDHPRSHELIRGIRGVLDAYPGDRMLLGEVYLLSTRRVAQYYGHGDELHLAFNFPPLYAPWDAAAWRTRIERVVAELDPRGAWPTWVLSNHDNTRHRSRYGSEARARAAAVLLLTLRGTPFLYAGEELGLEDAVVPPERVVDPGGRDGCRAPIPWTRAPGHGWPTDPWLPFPPDAAARSVEALRADPGSILHLYRDLIAVRRASPALSVGDLELIDAADGILAWRRRHGDDERAVAVNFTGEALPAPVAGIVEVASDRSGEGAPLGATLGADQAVIVRPS